MRKLSVVLGLLFFLVLLFFDGCRPNVQNAYTSVFSIEVFNPLDEARSDVMVRIAESNVYATYPDFNPNAFRVVDNEAEVASQFSDEGLEVVLNEMKPNEHRSLTVYYNKDGTIEHNYAKRTQAELSRKTGGGWKDREYIGGQFQNVSQLRVPPEHKDHSWFLRYEGPGWESDKVGYRFYLDQRNAVDVFGKKTSDMVLMGVGQDNFDSYHEMQPWGMDIAKVGKSLGLGSIGMWVDTSAVRIEKTDSVECMINADGQLSSSIITNYYGWKTKMDTMNVISVLSIDGGSRWTVNSITVTNEAANICTGIVKDNKAKVFKSPGNDKTYGYLATYGKQSLNNDNMGLAVIFAPQEFAAFREDGFSNVIDMKTNNGSFTYYFAAAWELEPNGITNEADFIKYVEKSARELANPVVVTLQKTLNEEDSDDSNTVVGDRRSSFGQAFIVTRNYRLKPEKEKVTLVLDWKQLQSHKIIPETGDFDITDGNFGKRLSKKIVDSNSDSQPDAVVIDYVFESDEPIFSFSVKPNAGSVSLSNASASADPRLVVTYLVSYSQLKKSGKDITNWPDKIIESTMAFYPDPATMPIYAPGNWSYEYAYFLNAMFQRWQETKKPEYLAYIKKWCDRFIDSHGSIDPKHYDVAQYRLDDMLPGRLFISLYEVTKDSRYKGAATQLRQQLQYQPRTTDGGYWHKQIYPYQMWLDGVYMADIFSMQYAKAFDEPALYRESMQQIKLIHEHNGDPGTGLLYHGWDEAGNKVWANEESGTSPEFWSRGIGWYLMATLECIDYVPLESADRKELGPLFSDLAKTVLKYQDPKTGLWYQVINKSYEPRNWHETSATAMFAYAFAKGHRKGILDKTYLAAAQKAFDALKDKYAFFDDEGRLYFDGTVKIGTLNVKTSKGDLDYYVSTERRINDYKGLGSLLYLAQELD